MNDETFTIKPAYNVNADEQDPTLTVSPPDHDGDTELKLSSKLGTIQQAVYLNNDERLQLIEYLLTFTNMTNYFQSNGVSDKTLAAYKEAWNGEHGND